MRFVLDTSITLCWCLDGQATELSDHVLGLMETSEVLVPSIWPLEVGSVISREGNRGIVTMEGAIHFLQILDGFDIAVAAAASRPSQVFGASRTHGLTGYDAMYVELALALRAPLATSDDKMREAALRAGVALMM